MRRVEGKITERGGTLYIILSPVRLAILDVTAMSYGLYLNRVNVPTEFTGQGIGGILMDALKEQAPMAGHELVIVDPGGYDPDKQEDRVRFYERHGFQLKPDGSYELKLKKIS